jgi:hypothetical protein
MEQMMSRPSARSVNPWPANFAVMNVCLPARAVPLVTLEDATAPDWTKFLLVPWHYFFLDFRFTL